MINLNKLPKNSVLCGASALAYLNLISFTPQKISIMMKSGTKKQYYFERGFNVFIDYHKLLDYKTEKINDIFIYTKERLYVDLVKTPLEATIKSQAIKNLEKIINPDEVKRIYDLLSKKYRKVDWKYVNDFLSKNLLDVEQKILKSPLLVGDLVREYTLAILGSLNLPILLKGGSAIELFLNLKRATADIDLLAKEQFKDVLNVLCDPKRKFYFKLDSKQFEKAKQKPIIKLDLQIVSKNDEVQKIINFQGLKPLTLKITFNLSFSNQEIQEIIEQYQLTKKKLRYFDQKSCYTISLEMLIAEKFYAIIGMPTTSKRSKDLIDLFLLTNEDYNLSKVLKWYLRKNNVANRLPRTNKEAVALILENINYQLTKIESNWSEATKMYDLPITYQEAYFNYQELGNKLFKLAKDQKLLDNKAN